MHPAITRPIACRLPLSVHAFRSLPTAQAVSTSPLLSTRLTSHRLFAPFPSSTPRLPISPRRHPDPCPPTTHLHLAPPPRRPLQTDYPFPLATSQASRLPDPGSLRRPSTTPAEPSPAGRPISFDCPTRHSAHHLVTTILCHPPPVHSHRLPCSAQFSPNHIDYPAQVDPTRVTDHSRRPP
jgi:hypothetical protein